MEISVIRFCFLVEFSTVWFCFALSNICFSLEFSTIFSLIFIFWTIDYLFFDGIFHYFFTNNFLFFELSTICFLWNFSLFRWFNLFFDYRLFVYVITDFLLELFHLIAFWRLINWRSIIIGFSCQVSWCWCRLSITLVLVRLSTIDYLGVSVDYRLPWYWFAVCFSL